MHGLAIHVGYPRADASACVNAFARRASHSECPHPSRWVRRHVQRTHGTYARTYAPTRTWWCVCLGGLVGYALRHTNDPNDHRSHTRPTTPSPTGQCPTKYCGFGLQATQPPVHKAPRAVELQPHTPRVHKHLNAAHLVMGVRGIIRDKPWCARSSYPGQPDPLHVELRSVHAWTDARIYQQFFNTGLCAAWRQYF